MFEKEMTSRFERDYGSSVENTTVDKNQTYDADMEYDSDGNTVDPRSARGIKMRYLRERAKKKAIAEKTGDTTPQVDEHALLPIQGMLSGVFHPYMGPYVALERQNLEEQVRRKSKYLLLELYTNSLFRSPARQRRRRLQPRQPRRNARLHLFHKPICLHEKQARQCEERSDELGMR
ncbi:hypothetical protein TL16_g01345 [Triparma laevis f. inornata]|uniref:Uncharacterized protein n=1 Tax=Triparma laevis f. inornata TaxID=1714386 RepID=A0A9W6ZM04_9STRA|nr:hypothetical protein TL16_g01345 [Triparma laevis f. inornata]